MSEIDETANYNDDIESRLKAAVESFKSISKLLIVAKKYGVLSVGFNAP